MVKLKKNFSLTELVAGIILLLAASWTLFCHIGVAPLWKPEGRVAEVVREMFVRNDFLHPTSGWIPHVTKPLIPYWLAAATAVIHGALDEWSLRIPSAIAGLISVVSTVLLGYRISSMRIGLISGAVLGSCFGFVLWGRCAAADIMSLSAITVAVTWYWWWRNEAKWWQVLFFGVLVALSSQMKGLVGITVTGLVVLLDVLFAKKIKLFLRPHLILSFLVGFSVYIIPFLISSSTAYSGDFNWISRAIYESVTRFIHPFDHKGSPWMYVYFVPIWLLPWTPLFLYAFFRKSLSFRSISYEERWLILSIAAIFIFFTASGSRRSYYILPILPFCSLLIGQLFWEKIRSNNLKNILKIQTPLFFLLGTGLIAAWLGAGLIIEKSGLPEDLFTKMGIHGAGIVIFSALSLFFKKKIWLSSVALLATGFMTTGGLFCMDKALLDSYNAEKEFVLEIKEILTSHPDATVGYYLVGARPRTRLSFYLNRKGPVPVLRTGSDLAAFLEKNKKWILIYMKEDEESIFDELKKNSTRYRDMITEKIFPWEGWPKDQELQIRKKYVAITSFKTLMDDSTSR